MKKLVFALVLMIAFMVSAAEIYNAGDTVPIWFSIDPGTTITGDVIAEVYRDSSTLLFTDTLEIVADTDDLVYYGEYVSSDTSANGNYSVRYLWTYDGSDYKRVENFQLKILTTTLSDSLAGYGYITQAAVGGAITLPGGSAAYNADIVVFNASTTSVVTVKRGVVDVAGNFKIWVPLLDSEGESATYDLEIRLTGYHPSKYRNLSPTAP